MRMTTYGVRYILLLFTLFLNIVYEGKLSIRKDISSAARCVRHFSSQFCVGVREEILEPVSSGFVTL